MSVPKTHLHLESLYYHQRLRDTDESRWSGEFNTGNRVGPLIYTNALQLLSKFFLNCKFEHGMNSNWRNMCIVVDSIRWRIGADSHMPLLEYAGKRLKSRMRQEIASLQKGYSLGEASIYLTRNGAQVYFFDDTVSGDVYKKMIQDTSCASKFLSNILQGDGVGKLRISSKYTEYDIFLAEIMPDPQKRLRRSDAKASTIKHLLRLGEESQGHLAKLFPQWALFVEDESPWGSKKKTSITISVTGKGKYIKKVSKSEVDSVVNKPYQPELIQNIQKSMEKTENTTG